ncbi:MAG TPA: ABC transporter ATP-binding protein [Accumulibacter sp.]|uniref:ABC transporter ATP-binding protein n=1 Tax=Accumulibacter sp. TaxID=2053492 RepID=UPI00287AA0B2|nr:ABC transporter ATP-binding protein [Accumulibacter sp.]MDS4056172.1 ABC transporter ATP-binding protein [Accumulibacter sp.]HMV06009.1 ABC transporter ATP-binding protein [Accumulibacter sp.]HMW63744.1 ABC transporter ATP-binding protein [Accumulibacter sp.]HMX68432.1 ABC transporter ATP-binding protein [Accumulibacter sp.]HNB68036.1 ABC transporter ATP-binding protein [Accumulibacter sp.]
MSEEPLISVERLGKKFGKSLKHNMLYGVADLTRDFLGQSRRGATLREGEFWSLEDINFQVRRGECLGIIGPNGAGKSTLLKLLNGIIAPDQGRVEIAHRVGALIEVGAGFHPMLTGRENIFVNGAILGMSKEEIGKKFDAIVDFADIGAFIDSPVKHYSSGMYVRLGFAIAAQVEPDVLLIDEVLAVGDAGFRSKCYNCIGHLASRCAIVFVSHAMAAISRLSTRVLVLDHGRAVFHGQPPEAISCYHRLFDARVQPSRQGLGTARIHSVEFIDASGRKVRSIRQGQPLGVRLAVYSQVAITNVCLDLVFVSLADEVVAECNSQLSGMSIDLMANREIQVLALIDSFSLNAGDYRLSALVLSADMVTHYDWQKDVASLEVCADRVGVAGQQYRAQWTIEERASMDSKEAR